MLTRKLNNVSEPKAPEPRPLAGKKSERPVIDKEFADQIRKDYGDEVFNELYNAEIDEDALKDYGGEIINEVEDLQDEWPPKRPTEYRGRQVADDEEEDDDEDAQKNSTLDEFMRLQN